MKRIAVVSGGVRAAAIAVKSAVINTVKPQSLDVVIYEADEIGSRWTGEYGYTDGRQHLCTEVERDLGFPYTCDLFASRTVNQSIDDLMLKEYSWQAYNIAQGSAYPEWISRGAPAPTHFEFAGYLKWAVRKSGCRVVSANATAIDYDAAAAKWAVTAIHTDANFDAVVVTGTRPRTDVWARPGDPLHQYVATAEDFWSRIPDLHRVLHDAADLHGVAVVGIVGTGAAAATVAAHLLRRVCEIESDLTKLLEIQLVGRSPFVAPRHPNYFQDRVFHDVEAWQKVPDKADFVRQAVFGSVWTSLIDQVSADRRVTIRKLDTTGVRYLDPTRTQYPASIVLEPFNNKNDKALALVVDCRGQRDGWFIESIPGSGTDFLSSQIQAILGPLVPASKNRVDFVRGQIGQGLCVDLPGFPPGLHAPMLGSEIGPGAANLMALGWVADCVLRAYL